MVDRIKTLPVAAVAVISGLFMMFVAVGGWIWILATQAGAVTDTTRRVAVLENKVDAADVYDRDVIARLSRIEGRLETMLSKVSNR